MWLGAAWINSSALHAGENAILIRGEYPQFAFEIRGFSPHLKEIRLMAAVPGLRRSELGDALRACRTALIGLGFMSCMINLLYLTGSIFMLEVYDRVLPSRSIPTLVGLIVLASGL